MRTAIHYADPEPTLTDAEVRALQDDWDAESLMPPAVPDGAWELWQLPLAMLGAVLGYTWLGGLLINWATGR